VSLKIQRLDAKVLTRLAMGEEVCEKMGSLGNVVPSSSPCSFFLPCITFEADGMRVEAGGERFTEPPQSLTAP
jgi:hypothetical protein